MKASKIRIFNGVLIGAINGIFGGGGGMICVPLLQSMGMESQKAHATAIAIIAPICLVSAIVYLIAETVQLSQLIPTAIGSILGGWLGAKLLGKLPPIVTRIMFICIMGIAGVRMVL